MMCVMARLNLTLDPDTEAKLARHAAERSTARAALARELLREALERREAQAARRKLAADYAAGLADARALLRDLEAAQVELMGDEED